MNLVSYSKALVGDSKPMTPAKYMILDRCNFMLGIFMGCFLWVEKILHEEVIEVRRNLLFDPIGHFGAVEKLLSKLVIIFQFCCLNIHVRLLFLVLR